MEGDGDVEPHSTALIKDGRIENWGIEDYAFLVPSDDNEGLEEKEREVYFTTVVSSLIENETYWNNGFHEDSNNGKDALIRAPRNNFFEAVRRI